MIDRCAASHEERVDRNVWRFLLATFGFIVTVLLILATFSLRSLYDMALASRTDARKADTAISVLQEQSRSITDQLKTQQQTSATLAATVQSLHDEVVRNSVRLDVIHAPKVTKETGP